MRLLVDANIVLDVALGRTPWVEDSAKLLDAIDTGRAKGFVAGHTVTTLYYIAAKERGRSGAAAIVADLLRIVKVAPVETGDFLQALGMGLPDFEDAVQVVAGLNVGADFVATRNQKDFRGAPIPARAPGEILALL
ncbi:MAG TPA: PIN domain-containing protein [Longimicrobiaceae bacterium]|jgi:predicted nucleic acid-binding protein|nr:PIN domain-containing protein [Longimicrobiaceae bacterium]